MAGQKEITKIRRSKSIGFRLALLVSIAIILFGAVSIWFVTSWQENAYMNEKFRQWETSIASQIPNLVNPLASNNSEGISFTLDRLAAGNEDIRQLILTDEKGRIIYSLDNSIPGGKIDSEWRRKLSLNTRREDQTGMLIKQYSRQIKTASTPLGELYAGFAMIPSLEKERQKSVLMLEYMIDNAIRNPLISYDFYEVDFVAKAIIKDVPDLAYFRIVAADGTVLSNLSANKTMNKTRDAYLENILSEEGVRKPVWTRNFRMGNRPVLEVILVMSEGTEKLGLIQAGYDMSSLKGSIIRRNAMLAALSTGAIFIAVAVAMIIAGRISRPVVHLAKVAQRVGTGDLDAKAQVDSGGDEMRLLGSAFNKMVAGLKERDLYKDTFSRYVTKQVVDEVMKNPGKISLGGDKREVTILFSDIRGFTTFAEVHPPEEVISHLNEYLSAMIDVIFKHDGTLDKFIGDAVMAVYGSPLAREDDPLRAVKTALDMQERLGELNSKWQAAGKPLLRIGIGINTGEVIAGNIGDMRRLEYTVIGDNVNLASRLESLTKNYDCPIIISESTYLKVENSVDVKKLESVNVKGKTQAVVVYQLIGLKNTDKIPKSV